MKITGNSRPYKVILVVFSIISLIILAVVVHILAVDNTVHRQINELRNQERLLAIPQAQRRAEKNIGCTWADRQDWDLEGCYIGLEDVYDEQGPGNALEQTLTQRLQSHGWQKNNSYAVYFSEAVEMYGNEASFTKQTAKGKFCAGFSHRAFSDDPNGHRALYFYILGPSDKSCLRWQT